MKTIEHRARRHPAVATATILALLGTVAVFAGTYDNTDQLESRYRPGQYAEPTIGVLQAVRTALEHDPNVHLSWLSTEQRRGRVQESTGLFDAAVTIDTSFAHSRSELTSAGLGSEVQRRDTFRLSATILQSIADDMREQLEAGAPFAFADCPQGTDFTIGGTPICVSGREQANINLFTGLIENFGTEDQQQIYFDLARRATENTIDVLRATAFSLREGLRRVGTMPEVDESTAFSLDLRYTRMFRNGWSLSPGVIIETTRDVFEGKPKDPAFGGKGVPDSFTGVLGLVLDIPLGKGSGRVSAEAPERAANLNYSASLNSYANTMSLTARNTLLAYWNLVAAQQRLEVLQASTARQERYLELTEGLIEADELAGVDVLQVQARVADVRAFSAQARQAVLRARIDLADVMGLEVNESADAPLAADGFPPTPEARALSGWKGHELAGIGLENRDDVKAQRHLEESARVLAEAARNDLKRIWDLTFSLGYSGLYEGGSMTNGVEFFKGVHEAFWGGMAGPSAQVVLTVDFPFANNVALGQLAQANSSARTSIIQRRNLERVITDQTQRLVGELRKVVAEIGRRQASVDQYITSLGFEIEKFRLGEATTIDLILMEARQTSARLSF